MWRPSQRFKEYFTSIGFFVVSLFVIGVFVIQCGLWVLIPVFLLVIILKVVERQRR